MVRGLVNCHRYPIDRPGAERRAAVESARVQLADSGCAVLPDFLSDLGLELLREEARERSYKAYFADVKEANVYLGDPDPELPVDHPRNRFSRRTNGFVRSYEWDGETSSRRLYEWPPLERFIADCLGKDELYVYEDPVSNMIVNVQQPGQEFNWHFDTNEFTITMLLQESEAGGHFEYVPGIRSPDEESIDAVTAVLDGDRDLVRRLDLSPGDLQLFLGRYSLHRVTPTEGATDRLLLIMSFADQPGMVGSVQRIRNLYGDVTERHLQQSVEGARADGLLD